MTRKRLCLAAASFALLVLPAWLWASSDVETQRWSADDASAQASRASAGPSASAAAAARRPVRGRRADAEQLAEEREESAEAVEAVEAGRGERAARISNLRRCCSKIDFHWFQLRQAGVPAASREAARELSVSDTVLELAFEAYLAAIQYHGDGEPAEKLAEHRGEGFRALVALLHGGLTDDVADALLASTFVPGEEGNLLAAAERAEGTDRHAALLRRLGSADAPSVREHLLRRLYAETDAARFAACATALGRLKERRALATCAAALRNDTWGGAHRRPICAAMIAIDARAAADAFVDHLRRPDTDFLDGVAGYLATVDPALAAREADLLLHGRLADADADRRKSLQAIADWTPAPQT